MVEEYIYALYTETATMQEAVEKLKSMLPRLASHILTSHKQWNEHALFHENLDESAIIQWKIIRWTWMLFLLRTQLLWNMLQTTKAFALYPVYVEYINDDGELNKGAICFLKEDTKHDHQQVVRFEKIMFEIVRDKLQRPIIN